MAVADDRVVALVNEIDCQRDFARGCLEALDHLPPEVADVQRLLDATRPIMLLVLKLGVGERPGVGLEVDADWAVAAAFARREVLANLEAGFDDASTARNIALIDRICALIGDWPEPYWSDVVGDRVQRTAEARRSGRARGQQLSNDRKRETSSTTTAGWLLRHPSDHYFSKALEVVSDSQLRAALNDWAAALGSSYGALITQDWNIEQSPEDVLVEVEVIDAPVANWTEPVFAMVLKSQQRDTAPGSTLALRQVADPLAAFNGTLFSMLSGEHWLVCGDRLDDGSTLVRDGTRRLKKQAEILASLLVDHIGIA